MSSLATPPLNHEPPLSHEPPQAAWPFLADPLLRRSRSGRVCLTCQWFGHVAGVDAIPLLLCERHRGLLSHGDHLSRRCPAWTPRLERQRGWCPEAG